MRPDKITTYKSQLYRKTTTNLFLFKKIT